MLALRKVAILAFATASLVLISLPVNAQTPNEDPPKKACDPELLEDGIAKVVGKARAADSKWTRSLIERVNRKIKGLRVRFENASCSGEFPEELVPADIEAAIKGGSYSGPGDTVPPNN